MKANETRLRIYFTGVGGQGTLTATNLLAKTALMSGLEVVSGEVHGMAQRGGVVESVLLLGGWRSPKLDVNEADLLLGFEPLETLRGLPYLAPGGVVISSSNPLPPLSVSLGQSVYPDLETIKAKVKTVAKEAYFLPARELGLKAGSIQSGNTVLVACACACGVLPFDLNALKEGIRTFLPPKLHDTNLKALDLAQEYLQKK